MWLQVRLYDGRSDEIDLTESHHARVFASAFDWQEQRRQFDDLSARGGEGYFPSLSLTDDAGRVLEFGPNADETFWISYGYTIQKSTFGFCTLDCWREQRLPSCPLETALDLMDHHFAASHQEIVDFLPAVQEPDGTDAPKQEPPPSR